MNGLSAHSGIEKLFITMHTTLVEEENSSVLCNENEEVKSIVQLLKALTPTTPNLVEKLNDITGSIKKLGEANNRGLMMMSARLQRIVQPVMQKLSPPPPKPLVVQPVVVQRALNRGVNGNKTIAKASPVSTPTAKPPQAVSLQVRPTLKLNLSKPIVVRPSLQEEGKRCPSKINFDFICYINSPLQGLMYSAYFNQFLTLKEKERSQEISIDQANCYLDWFLVIKKEWNVGNNEKLNSTLDAFKAWVLKNDTSFRKNDGDTYEFLEKLMEAINLHSGDVFQSEMPWGMGVSLSSAFEEKANLCLQEMTQKDFNRTLSQRFISWFSSAKHVWGLQDNVSLPFMLNMFGVWIKAVYPNFSKGEKVEFLQTLCDEKKDELLNMSLPDLPWDITVSLYHAFKESLGEEFHKAVKQEFDKMQAEHSAKLENQEKVVFKIPALPNMLFLHYPHDYDFGRLGGIRAFETKKELVFPQDNILTLDEHKYQLTSFTCAAQIGHYFQCLYLDGRWIKCDDNKIEVIIPRELEEYKQKAYVLFFEKIEQNKEESA